MLNSLKLITYAEIIADTAGLIIEFAVSVLNLIFFRRVNVLAIPLKNSLM